MLCTSQTHRLHNVRVAFRMERSNWGYVGCGQLGFPTSKMQLDDRMEMEGQRAIFAVCGIALLAIAAFGIYVGVDSYMEDLRLQSTPGTSGSDHLGPAVGFMLAIYYTPLAIPGVGAIVAAFKITRTRLTVNTVFLVFLWIFWFPLAVMTIVQGMASYGSYGMTSPILGFEAFILITIPLLTYCIVSCNKKLKRQREEQQCSQPQS